VLETHFDRNVDVTARAPRWRVEQPTDLSPSLKQAIRQTEQQLPPFEPDLVADRIDYEERALPRWLAQLDEPTDPTFGPSSNDTGPSFLGRRKAPDHPYARGTLREEKIDRRTQLGRRIWALPKTVYKPPATAAEKRWLKAGKKLKVEPKLVPKDAPRMGLGADAYDAVAAFFATGGEVTVCPPETTTRKLSARIGCPPIGESAMSDAERSERRRMKRKLLETVRKWFVGPLRVEVQDRPSTDALRTVVRAMRAMWRAKLKLIAATPLIASGDDTNVDDRRGQQHSSRVGKGGDAGTRRETT
jgi:hypothetical protein